MFIEGLEQLTPVGLQTSGEDARFEAVLKVGVRTLRTTIVITSLEPRRSITWSSAGDDGQSLKFDLSPRRGETTVSLTVTYEQPGGMAGALIACRSSSTRSSTGQPGHWNGSASTFHPREQLVTTLAGAFFTPRRPCLTRDVQGWRRTSR